MYNIGIHLVEFLDSFVTGCTVCICNTDTNCVSSIITIFKLCVSTSYSIVTRVRICICIWVSRYHGGHDINLTPRFIMSEPKTAVINGITYYEKTSDHGNCYIENQCTCTGKYCDCSQDKCVYNANESFANFDSDPETQCNNESSSLLIFIAMVMGVLIYVYRAALTRGFMILLIIVAAVFMIVGISTMCKF